MPAKYSIHTAATAPRVRPVGKLGIGGVDDGIQHLLGQIALAYLNDLT